MGPLQFFKELFRPAFLPDMKAQREHLENRGLHIFGRGTTSLAFPQAIDSGPLFEIGDLSLQVAVDFEELLEPGEMDFHGGERDWRR